MRVRRQEPGQGITERLALRCCVARDEKRGSCLEQQPQQRGQLGVEDPGADEAGDREQGCGWRRGPGPARIPGPARRPRRPVRRHLPRRVGRPVSGYLKNPAAAYTYLTPYTVFTRLPSILSILSQAAPALPQAPAV